IFELEITSDSMFAGRQVKDIVEELSEPIAFGAITRDGDVIIPRGDTTIKTGDHVVLFTAGDIESFNV
ncbi:MAG: TrkA C-terminal domain-containing protein, partial [Halobacteriaceae archaeon]